MEKFAIGFCTECLNEVYNTDGQSSEIDGCYECSVCGHPHLKEEVIPLDEDF